MGNNTVGCVGEKYYDTKSTLQGTVISKDEENRVLLLEDFNEPSVTFSIPFSIFKYHWRRLRDKDCEEEDGENDETDTQQTNDVCGGETPEYGGDTPCNVCAIHDYGGETTEMTDDEFVSAVNAVGRVANIVRDENNLEVYVDSVRVLFTDFRTICMLPDIYVGSRVGLEDICVPDTLKVNLNQHETITFLCKIGVTDALILGTICGACRNINLYGYVKE